MYFENFKNDTVDSLVFRYPGTTVYTDATSLNTHGFPLAQGATAVQYSSFTAPHIPTGDIISIALIFDNIDTPTRGAKSTLTVFGLFEITQDDSKLTVTNPSGTGTPITYPSVVIKPSTKSINIQYVQSLKMLTILIDHQPVILRQTIDWSPTYTPTIFAKGDLGFTYGPLPSSLKLLVVTDKHDRGTLFDPDTLEVLYSTLTYVSSDGMDYSDLGYNQDIISSDPLRSSPSVYAKNETGTITYQNDLPATTNPGSTLLSQQLYSGGRSPTQNPLYLNNSLLTVMGNAAKAVAPVVTPSGELILEYRNT